MEGPLSLVCVMGARRSNRRLLFVTTVCNSHFRQLQTVVPISSEFRRRWKRAQAAFPRGGMSNGEPNCPLIRLGLHRVLAEIK